MKFIFILFASISTILSSCGGNKEKITQKQPIHEHDENQESIELNNGEKWKVDDEMLVHIRNMERDINSFVTIEQKDYKLLAEKLKLNIDLLTSNCTMKGKAHDELHKWLLPYIDLVNELSNAKDVTNASKQFENIQASFKTFNQYFQ